MKALKGLSSDAFVYWIKPALILGYMLCVLAAPFAVLHVLHVLMGQTLPRVELLQWILPLTGVALLVPTPFPALLKVFISVAYYFSVALCFPLLGLIFGCLIGNCL